MNKIIIFILIFLSFIPWIIAYNPDVKESQNYRVTKVIDWDTVQINYNWNNTLLRLIWIDSPESYKLRFWYKECFWEDASRYLKNIIEWKDIKIEFDESQWKTDKYWRYLAYIFLDWKNINEEMIKNGYAWEYTYNKAYKYKNNFKSSQKLASKNKSWLWSTINCNWKRKKIKEEKLEKISKPEIDTEIDTLNNNLINTKKSNTSVNINTQIKKSSSPISSSNSNNKSLRTYYT